jgi:hypothetical protein
MTVTLLHALPWIGITAGLFWLLVGAIIAFCNPLRHLYHALERMLHSLMQSLVPRDWQNQ